MKEGWEVKKLGEVCKFSQGVQIPLEEQYTTCEKGMIRFLRIIDFTQKGETPRYIYNVDDKYILHDNEIAIVRYGTPGFVCYGKVGAIANNLFKILPKESLFDFAFLKYWLSSEAFQGVIKGSKYGVALQAIKFSTISEIFVPIPPLLEQIRIVEELDLLSNIIEKKRQQLSELNNLAQSIFYDMFGDPVTANYSKVPLKELSVIIGDGLHGTPNYSEDGECCFINGNNLVEGKIVFYKSSKFVDAEEKRKYYVELDYNTLLVSINGTLGKTAYYNGENIILGKSACYIRLKEEVNKVYIYNILCSDYFKKYAQENATGSTIRNVSLKTMRNFLIPMPPIEKQNEYMEKIEAIEKQKALIKQSIAETEELFNSRMDYYFN